MDNNGRTRGRYGGLLSYLKKGDIIIISALLGLSLLLGIISAASSCVGDSGENTYAVITLDGRELARLPLDADGEYVISSSDAHNTVTVSDGAVMMTHADCPDGLCVAQGAIRRPGQSIVCLPNRVAVTIESDGAEQPDSVAY